MWLQLCSNKERSYRYPVCDLVLVVLVNALTHSSRDAGACRRTHKYEYVDIIRTLQQQSGGLALLTAAHGGVMRQSHIRRRNTREMRDGER